MRYSPSWDTNYHASGRTHDQEVQPSGAHTRIESKGGEVLVQPCQEAALTRRIAWRRSRGGVGLGPSGKQLHPATPELTAWRERPADSSQLMC